MLKLGLTGGIGSGKTYVARLLEDRGIPVYFTDDAAKHLMVTDNGIREALSAKMGKEAYLPDGSLDRSAVAAWLFSDQTRIEAINAIVHPVVRADFLQWTERQSAPLVVMECAILYESGFDNLVDCVLTVCAPEQVRLERVMQRDGTVEEKVRDRMAAQWSDEERRARANHIIWNDGKTDVQAELDVLLPRLLQAHGLCD